jgi:putative ABC transport system permease protein
MIVGSLFDLRKPDAVIMDLEGYQLLWPGEEPRIGRRFEMNDHVAEIVGICKASRTFQTFPVVYTRYSQALEFVPPERKVLSFVLAEVKPGQAVDTVCRRIEAQTNLRAVTGTQFEWITMTYFMKKTGIPFNFGITVALGFIVGTAIAAQTFYLFTIENIKQYGALKAMGAGNWSLMAMILLQALLVSTIGFGLGIGAATWRSCRTTSPGSRLAFYMPWEVFIGTGLAVGAISIFSSLLSMQRVMVVEPAVVFQG